MTDLPHDIESAGPLVIGFYLYLVEENGQSPRMAEMLALRQAPGIMTDDVALGGIGYLQDQIKDPMALNYIVKTAKRHGYNPKPTDFYNSAIAAYPGDPDAFLSHGQGRGHVRKVLEKRGYVTGTSPDGNMVPIKGSRSPESDPWKQKHQLAPNIVERIRKRKLKEDPSLALKDQGELRHEIVQEHGHNKDR